MLPDGRRLIELHALEAAGEVLALFGCIVDGYRFSCMFNTYTLSEHARYSPGLILIGHMLDGAAERGSRSFDIGVGRAHYKSIFCREQEPLFDTFVGLTPSGRVAAAAMAGGYAVKRGIKRSHALWGAVQSLRRIRAEN
jgi:CelD/BcsL family acetyltransferase involved in cellulose biosynthesis